MNPDISPSPFAVPAFLERRSVRWAEVGSVYHTLHQTFCYLYPGPIYDLRHELMVAPRGGYGGQELCSFEVAVTPKLEPRRKTDTFGNTVLKLEAAEVMGRLEFHVFSTLKCVAGIPPASLRSEDIAPFHELTHLTEATPKMTVIARELRGTYAGPLAFAAKLNDWVFHALRYGFGATDTRTTAAEALSGGVGLCQDYAHVMIAMCRAAGVAARYVSGHMLGEGGSHAWVEVLLPEKDGFVAYAFDPTNRRRPGLDYLTVAIGRDYSDVPPTAGTFEAPYGGALSWTKQAGLTRVEYHSGEVLSV